MVRTHSDTTLHTGGTDIREIVAVFTSTDQLEGAINDLASNGWDRADMSLLAQEHVFSGDVSDLVKDSKRVADDPSAPRGSVVSESDVRQSRTLATSLAGTIAAFIATGATILTGGGALAAIAGAAVAGGGAGALVNAVGRKAKGSREDFLHEQAERGGIVLWVALRDETREPVARQILERRGAKDIHVHQGPG